MDFRSQGQGFEPCEIADPTLDENLDRPFGRGVFLMRTYMNEVSYNSAGNSVTLVRRRGGPRADSK